VVDNFPGSI